MIAALLLRIAPWRVWGEVLAFLAIIATGLAYHHHVYMSGDTAGFQRRDAQAKRDEIAITAQVAARYTKDLADARERTAQLQREADIAAVARQQERDHHEADIQTHVTAALAGTERLRVATSCPVRSETPAATTAATGGSGSETGTDLMPGTAAAIFRIAGDSRQLVLDYNAVIDRYDKLRATCNAE